MSEGGNLHQFNFPEAAKKIVALHEGLSKKTRLLINDALEIGDLLIQAQKNCEHGEFVSWLGKNINFSDRTAYKYISLFNHKNQIASAENLQDAYRQIETLEAQKKQTETQKAYNRVAEFRKTGVKPEGWRQHTDDKLLKEEQERDNRIEAVKRKSLERKREKEKEQAEWDARRAESKRIIEEATAETEILTDFLSKKIEVDRKREEFKTKIRLSADGMKDPFQDAILDYLEGLENDSRRIEACYNIIKVCKRIAVELQGKTA